jgi:hypothetical protein
MRGEQVMTAKRHKGALLFSDTSLDQRFDRAGQVIVTQPMRHSSKVLKGTHMPVKEGFLLACRESHDKRSA